MSTLYGRIFHDRLDGHCDIFGWSAAEIDRHGDGHPIVPLPPGNRPQQSHLGLIKRDTASIGSQRDSTETGQQHPHHRQHDGDSGKGIPGSSTERALCAHATESSHQSATTSLLQEDDQDHQRAIDDKRPAQSSTGTADKPSEEKTHRGQNQEEQIQLPVVLEVFE